MDPLLHCQCQCQHLYLLMEVAQLGSLTPTLAMAATMGVSRGSRTGRLRNKHF